MTDAIVIQVFAREPIPGLCKRRLIPALGAQGAAELHAAMVRRTVEAATRAAPGQVQLWRSGGDSGNFLKALAAEFDCDLRAQSGADLGARMYAALLSAHNERQGAVLVGTDCPELSAPRLVEATEALRAGYDAVFRPARDGGYVCVGMRVPMAELFSEMPWGTADVMAMTRARLARLHLRWLEFAALADIDRPPDLSNLPPEIGHFAVAR
jgi:uncharacterized protein